MQIGRLRDQVTIQQRSSGRDAAGQKATTWTEVARVWGEVRRQRGMEALRADSPVSIVKASIRVRRRTDVTAAMRAVHLGVAYEIRAVLPDSKDRGYMFLACEGVSNG